MPAYRVAAQKTTQGFINDVSTAIVFAADATQALEMAKGVHVNSPEEIWDNGTATEIVAGTDMNGWELELILQGDGEKLVYRTTGGATDTLDDLGTALVALMTTRFATATYTTATNVLSIPLGEAVGDYERSARLHFKGGAPSAIQPVLNAVGIEASEVTLTMPVDATVIPSVFGVVV